MTKPNPDDYFGDSKGEAKPKGKRSLNPDDYFGPIEPPKPKAEKPSLIKRGLAALSTPAPSDAPRDGARRGGTTAELRQGAFGADEPAAEESAAGAGRGFVNPDVVRSDGRRGGTPAALREGAYVAGTVEPPAPTPTAGELLETPRGDFQPSQADLEWQSLSPAKQQEILALKARRGSPGAVASEPGVAETIAANVRDATSNPVARGAVAGFSQLGQTGVGAVRAVADTVGADGVADFAAGASGKATQIGTGATRDLKGNDKLVADVSSSILNSAPALAVGMAGGDPLRTLFAQSALAAYNSGRDAGFSPAESATRAGIMGLAEALGERFGLPQQIALLKSVAKHVPTGELAKTFGSMIAREIPGEQLTTAMQFLADKLGPAALNPNASLADYLNQAGETLKVTIGQTAVMGGGPAAIGTVRDTYSKANRTTAAPEQILAQAIDQAAAQFGLNTKAAATLREKIASMDPDAATNYAEKVFAAAERSGLVKKPGGGSAVRQNAKDLAAKAAKDAEAQQGDASGDSVLAGATASSDTGLADELDAGAILGTQAEAPQATSGEAPTEGATDGPMTDEPAQSGVEAGTEPPIEGDLTTGDGQPYGTKASARARATRDGGDVVEVLGGWVVRQSQPSNTRGTNAGDINAVSGTGSGPQPGAGGNAQPGSADTSGSGGTVDVVQGELPQPGATGTAGAVVPGADAGNRPAATGPGDGNEALTPAAPRSIMKPGFDSDAWQKERDDRIKASREAGNTHLDTVPAYVETMRGKQIGYVHDPKVKGRILTVDNNGNVYVEWLDAYSQEKEGATPMKMGNKTVMQTSLGPRDLKDYTLAADKPAPTLTPGQSVTIDGKPYTVKSAKPKVLVLTGADGKPRTITSDSATWAKVKPAEPNSVSDKPNSGTGPRILGKIGRTPNAAETVELRPNKDGTLTPHQGKYAMVDYETGEPVVIPGDSTNEQAIDAIKKSGAMGAKDKWFGVQKEQPDVVQGRAPVAQAQPDQKGTPAGGVEPAGAAAAPAVPAAGSAPVEADGMKPTLTMKPNGDGQYMLTAKDATGKRLGQAGFTVKEIGGKRYLSIDDISVKEQGRGVGSAMYEYAINNLPPGIDGVLSESGWRKNKQQVPAIHKKLAAKFNAVEIAEGTVFSPRAATPAAPAVVPGAGPAAVESGGLTPGKRQELQDARQMVEDMIATKRANREAVPDAWVKRLADISAQQRGEKADDGAVYSLEVEGHPLYDGRPVLRNLVPIKVSSVADAQRKLDNALDLERKVATEFYGAQQAMRAAKTAAQKKAAQARLTALNNQGWDADSLKALRDTTIGELSRLLDTATERFGGATPNAEAPVQAAPAVVPGAGNAAVEADGVKPTGPVIQNRDRSTPAAITQMRGIAGNPDYLRLSSSRDFTAGAPVIVGSIPLAQMGRKETMAAGKRRIPGVYAVVEAAELVASNSVDGSANPAFEKAATKVIAGNGRTAGLQEAYRTGKAGNYRSELEADESHGINPDVIRGMKAPVLVRVMPASEITDDIGDISNTQAGLQLSAVEQARNDANRVNLDALEFTEDGRITPDTVRRFVQAMPQAEQGNLINRDGSPTAQAVDRLNAVVFFKAYNSEPLTNLYAQTADPDARNIMSALAQAATSMARLEGAGALDIRPLIAEAAEIAINGRRNGLKLSEIAAQDRLDADPDTRVILNLFASNANKVKPVAEALKRAADFAYSEANKPADDMFGSVSQAGRGDVVSQIGPRDEARGAQNLEEPAGGKPAGRDAEGQSPEGPGQGNAGAAEEGASAGQAEGLTPAERRKLEAEYQTRATEVLQEVDRRGDLKKLFRSFAGVRTIDGFTELAIDEQASAYADYIEAGAKPVSFSESYTEKVTRMERDALVRRLQSDNEVRQSSGKPFKTEGSAKAFQREHDLAITHEPRAVDGGFVLRLRPPAAQAESRRAEAGLPSYAEAQSAVAAEMGIGETPDGELDATDEQFAEMDRRIAARMRGEAPPLSLTAESEADAQAKAKREADALAAEQKAKADEQARLKREANKREADARAAEILAEREAAKKAEVDAAADDFALGQEPPKPVDKKVDAKDLAGQKEIFGGATPFADPLTLNERQLNSLRGKPITMKAQTEDGQVASWEIDAAEAVQSLRSREATIQQLVRCLS